MAKEVIHMADETTKVNQKFVAKVVRVMVVTEEGKTNVTLMLNKEFEGFKFDKKSNEFEEVMIDRIGVSASDIINLVTSNEVAAFYASVIDDVYSQRAIGTMMCGAEIAIEREFHAKGEVVNDKALERDKWFTNITRYTPSVLGEKLMVKTIENV